MSTCHYLKPTLVFGSTFYQLNDYSRTKKRKARRRPLRAKPKNKRKVILPASACTFKILPILLTEISHNNRITFDVTPLELSIDSDTLSLTISTPSLSPYSPLSPISSSGEEKWESDIEDLIEGPLSYEQYKEQVEDDFEIVKESDYMNMKLSETQKSMHVLV